jgi:sugar transferase (PEP-CTERM/EpsH1 system associated)
MRLLYFAAHQMFPLTSGNRLRDYHLSRQLVRRASVTFVETCHEGEQPSSQSADSSYDSIVSLSKPAGYKLGNILRGLVGPTPIPVLNYFEPQSENLLANVLADRRFDTLQIEGIHLSRYLRVINTAAPRPRILADWHNIESELMWRYSEHTPSWSKRLVAKRTARLLEKAELQLLNKCDAHTVVSEREKRKLLALCPSANVHVVPNGVDTEHFASSGLAANALGSNSENSGHNLIYVGSMDYHANIDAVVWFARDVWPEIAKRHPKLKFVIVGRNPSEQIRRLESESIRVTGTVADVRPFYASAFAVVVPLRVGGGTRLKILEAMAAGVPVVTTHLGAEGISAEDRVHALFADTPREIIDAVDQLYRSAQLRQSLADGGKNLVAECYDWAALGENLYRLHASLLASKSQNQAGLN